MKQRLLFSLCFLAAIVVSCSDNDDYEDPLTVIEFQDAAFETALLVAGVDKNNSGYISTTEAEAVQSIDISNNSNVVLLSDLVYFTNITELNCSSTGVTTLDVSNNTLLEALNCSSTNIGSGTKSGSSSDLDLSYNVALKSLDISNTNIVNIDVSTNSALETLNVSNTEITELDLSSNTSLVTLNASNTYISTLDVSTNENLSNLNLADCESLASLIYNGEVQSASAWSVDDSVIRIDITNVITVVFNTNGGNDISNQTIIGGGVIEKPTDPTKDNSLFIAWYVDEELTEKWDFSSFITEDTTIYAAWSSLFTISTADELTMIGNSDSYPLNGTYTLTNDIALSGTWTPIGSIDAPFTGTFDGGGYTISGLSIVGSTTYQGFFACLNGATVKNVVIENPSIDAGYKNYVGGVAGYVEGDFTLEKCAIVGGTISGGGYLGGLIGTVSSSSFYTATISYCYNTASIVGKGQYVGGLIGYAAYKYSSSLNITACYNLGSVSNTSSYAGGLIGSAGSIGTILACYNRGAVNASGFIGGILGNGAKYTLLKCCYNTGSVSKNSASATVQAGDLIGYQTGDETVSYSYYIEQDDDVILAIGTDNAMLSSVSAVASIEELNSKVDIMNEQAGAVYYISGSPAQSEYPYISW